MKWYSPRIELVEAINLDISTWRIILEAVLTAIIVYSALPKRRKERQVSEVKASDRDYVLGQLTADVAYLKQQVKQLLNTRLIRQVNAADSPFVEISSPAPSPMNMQDIPEYTILI